MTDRRRRVATVAGSSTAALLAAAAGGATWYYAERITEAPGRRPVPTGPADVRLVADDGATVTLAGAGAARPGWWGLAGADGWVRIGPPEAAGPDDGDGVPTWVRRPVELRVGRLHAGETVTFDGDAVPADLTALDDAVVEAPVEGPLGPLPAWWRPVGDRRRVAVLVHGRSGSRREVARWMPTFVAAGWSTLALSYRNAPGAPAAPDGRSHLGATEWEDVAAAVDAVLAAGAQELVLLGASMGGACVAELLRRRELPQLRGVVLDAPVRHWGPVLRAAARQRGVPGAVVPLLLPPTMALAGARGRIDWRGLDHLDDPTRYATPTLLLHGDADATVPVALSDAFADARPDVVAYLRVTGADHLRSWNLDRPRAEATLTRFLGDLDGPSAVTDGPSRR